jgi:hypothetical protein
MAGMTYTGVPSPEVAEHASVRAVKTVTEAATLTPADSLVYATAPASSSYAITLPALSESKGRVFTIWCAGTAGSGGISIATKNDGIQAIHWPASAANMTAAGDFVTIENVNGLFWAVKYRKTT